MISKTKSLTIFTLLMAFFITFSLGFLNVMNKNVHADNATVVAQIGDTSYATFENALTAAKATTGDVIVEIYDKVTLKDNLSGSYDKICFVGKTESAEIYLDIQGYITATGEKVSFEKLKLSKSSGGYMTNAGFMNVAFGVYDVVEVAYTDCYFANGAYASSGKVTFTNCTFMRSYDKYGLWAYGNVDVTVDGCTFADYRGIKMYAEGKAKTVDLTVKNTDFSVATDKPAIVLTYGESVTLEGNTYPENGYVFELDLDGDPNGTTVFSSDPVNCKNDNGDCGVMVGNSIYTTVAQAATVAKEGETVTLLHNSSETVELPEGVILNKNNYISDGVTVKEPEPEGTIGAAHVAADDNGNLLKIWGEGGNANAKESYVIKLFSNDTLIATTELNNIGGIIDGSVYVTWNFFYPESSDEYWTTTWEKDELNTANIPNKVVLIVDGVEVAENVVKMSAPDDLKPVEWRKLGGVKIADLEGEGTKTSPYLISNLAELEFFRDNVNAGNNYSNKYVKLTDNIDLASVENWLPIGNSTNKFKGHFDGGEKTISNLKINNTASYVGLFGYTESGSLKNLTIENVDIDARLGVGALAGCPFTSDVDNITLTGKVTIDAKFYVGGVVGRNAYGDLTNITVDVSSESYVNADSVEDGTSYRTYVGGVVGFRGEGNSVMENVTSNIKVIGNISDIGGISGIGHYDNDFVNVTFNGLVVAPEDAENVGGIAGVWHNEKGHTVIFNNCQSTGSVVIGNEISMGSIVGEAYNSSNETFDTSGSLMIDGEEAWIKSCSINGVGYVTIDEAIENAKIGDEIVLLKDVDDSLTIAGVKIVSNGFNAPNVTVEALQIEEVTVERNAEDNATIVTITYLNCDKDTVIVIPDGKDGQDGANGTNGKDGIDGVDGVDGKDGQNGLNGTNGKDGVDGKDGLDGKDGKDGVDGKNGKDANNTLAIVGTVTGGIALIGYAVLVVILIKKKNS